MRLNFECALLCPPGDTHDTYKLIGSHSNNKLTVCSLSDTLPLTDFSSPEILPRLALALQRYDACLVVVDATQLAWLRTALQAAQGLLTTPIIGLCVDLKASALADLLDGGMADFVRAPFCVDELRARVSQLLNRRLRPASSAISEAAALCVNEPVHAARAVKSYRPARLAPHGYGSHGPASVSHVFDQIEDSCGMYIDAYVAAALSGEQTGFVTYQNAKKHLNDRFTSSYLNQSLRFHKGNVTKAASNAGKNRRAFSALMTLHRVDPGIYRLSHPEVDTEG